MGSDERTREQERIDIALRGHALLTSCEAGVATHLVPAEGTCDLGRDASCDVWLDDPSVSRRHACVHAGSPPLIEDLGSRNGTRIAGARVAPGVRVPVPAGTVIELGSATVVVQLASQNLVAQRGVAPAAGATLPPGVVVEDATVKRIYELIDVIAPSTLSLVILGETGVGKEVLAREVHRRSPRAARPFLALNCAALTDSLLESELFGHERGAFTGAVKAKIGLFEAAEQGTVFLDEIGELPLSTQATLLRVLETGEILRLGSVVTRRVDVRFVAATHRDLPSLVAEGAFRADLYFRINGMTVTLPPLRQRPRDIRALAQLFAGKACERAGSPRVHLTPAALAKLEAHAWSGNVRELRNVMDRGVLLARGGAIDVEQIMLDADPMRLSIAPPGATALRDQVGSFERERIIEALARTRGHQGKAAELLGISRRALIDKLDAHAIDRPRKR